MWYFGKTGIPFINILLLLHQEKEFSSEGYNRENYLCVDIYN